VIDAQVEGDWRRRFQLLVEELKQAGATSGVVRPTKVLYELSRMKGAAVLANATTAMQRRIKNEMVPVMEKSIEGKPEGWRRKAAKVYRRWMYRFVEELYVEVRRRSQWGTVTPETRKRKEKDAAREKEARRVELAARREARREARAVEKAAGGAAPKKKRAKRTKRTRRQPRSATAPNANTYGIRHTRPDWRLPQKGKAKAGKRRPAQAETEPVLIVTINGRVIARD
jgi:hypothetical protein